MNQKKLLTTSIELQPYLESLRHTLHAHPETGFDLTFIRLQPGTGACAHPPFRSCL